MNEPQIKNARPLPSLAELLDEFQGLDDWEDRYDYLIDLGRRLPPLPESLQNETNLVKGCQSTVWLVTRLRQTDEGPRLELAADSDALIVKGLIVVLMALFNNQPLREIPGLDESAVFARLGLNQHLSPQRRNGLFAMVKRIRQLSTSEVPGADVNRR